MEEKSTDRVLDVLDQATVIEEMFRDQAMAAHRARAAVTEQPDEDEDGNRYCLTCGDEIPALRIKYLPNAVRCVSCESKRENQQRIASARGGCFDSD
jgi:DnaK suppressor protein